MEILYLIIAMIIVLVFCILNARREVKYHIDSSLSLWTFIGGGVTCIFLYLFFSALTPFEPSALDVYRGKTTLEITEVVKDSVVIKRDSIVTFK